MFSKDKTVIELDTPSDNTSDARIDSNNIIQKTQDRI